MEISIEQDKCVSAGQCVATAPEVFDQRDRDGVVELLTSQAPAGSEQDVRHAAAACPAQAIHLHT